MFLPNVDVASYADDNTPYSAGNTVDEVLCSLQNSSKSMFDWFENNRMRANPEKSDLILTKPNTIETQICGEIINSTEIVKLLGINIDNKLTFEQHVDSLCNKASHKLNALERLAHYMSFEQRKLIMNSFITSQFSYCPLVWMFHSRRLNHRINRIQERALRINGSLTIHQRNLHILVTEINKANNGISPVLMKEMFEFPESKYNLRNTKTISYRIRTTKYGTETISHLGPKIWDMLPAECKDANSLMEFKHRIKKWIPENCPCRLCKRYVGEIGFH